jgi:hypothetical protein
VSSLDEERRRLHEGAAGLEPHGELDELEMEAGDAGRRLERVREVLTVVLDHSEGAWPGVDEWKRLLPGWFVAACVDDRELRDCVLDRWSIRSWAYWLQPDQRRWRWWDACTSDGGRLRIQLLVLERPYLRGSLDWLLEVAGAGAGE